MFEQDNQSDHVDTEQEVLLRIDYLDMRTSSRFDKLEERVRQLESQMRGMVDSGESDLNRLKRLGRSLFKSRQGVANKSPDVDSKFPVTIKQTILGLGIISGLVSFIVGNKESKPQTEILAFWLGQFLFLAAIPGFIAYLVAGRKKQWDRRDKWFFWCSLVISASALILSLQN